MASSYRAVTPWCCSSHILGGCLTGREDRPSLFRCGAHLRAFFHGTQRARVSWRNLLASGRDNNALAGSRPLRASAYGQAQILGIVVWGTPAFIETSGMSFSIAPRNVRVKGGGIGSGCGLHELRGRLGEDRVRTRVLFRGRLSSYRIAFGRLRSSG
jgi:hypothetical protein